MSIPTQDEIRELCRIPYKHGGLDVTAGLDCLTFILYYLKQYNGIDLDIYVTNYAEEWYYQTPDIYLKGVMKYCDVLPYKKGMPIVEGSLLFFSNIPNVPITHAGVYIGDGKLLHCLDIKGVVVHKINLCLNSLRFIGKIKPCKVRTGDK